MSDRFIVAKELAIKDGHDWENLSGEMRESYQHNADLVIAEQLAIKDKDGDVVGSVFDCPRCKDQAYIGDTRCMECNPVGLSVEEVHPRLASLMISNIKVGDVCAVLAPNRQALIATINNLVDSAQLRGGEGKVYLHVELAGKQLGCEGSSADYVTEVDVPYQSVPCTCGNPQHWLIKYEEEADEKSAAEASAKKAEEELAVEQVRAARPLKPSEYRCSKCSKPGKTIIHMVKKDGKGIGTKHKEFKV